MAVPTITQDSLVISSHIDAITDARHWAAEHARKSGFSREAVFAIELAIGEAVTNIIRHAYQEQPNHKIHLSLTIDKIQFKVTIVDFGRKFDPDSHHPPNLDTPHEGGYGIYLIKKVMDEVHYDTSPPKGTRLDMIKYRNTPPQ